MGRLHLRLGLGLSLGFGLGLGLGLSLGGLGGAWMRCLGGLGLGPALG